MNAREWRKMIDDIHESGRIEELISDLEAAESKLARLREVHICPVSHGAEREMELQWVCETCGHREATQEGYEPEEARGVEGSNTAQQPPIDFATRTEGTSADRPAEDGLREALEKIANHPHCQYDPVCNTPYDTGVTDGHRCAAVVALAALARGNP